MWQIVMGVETTRGNIIFGVSISARWPMGIHELSSTRRKKPRSAPLPVLLHVQLVAQQEHGAAALAAPCVQGKDLQVPLAALEALPVIDAVDNKEGAGPAQVTLTVLRAILGTRGGAEP